VVTRWCVVVNHVVVRVTNSTNAAAVSTGARAVRGIPTRLRVRYVNQTKAERYAIAMHA